MQIVLLNFSDAPRSLVDRRNRTVVVAPGEMKAADIHEAHFNLLKRGTFLALPEEVEIPERTLAAVRLMGAVNDTSYDELLTKFWGLADRDPDQLRPSRDTIRLALRDIAQNALAEIGVGGPAPRRVPIREEGDENTRRDPDEDEGAGDDAVVKEPDAPTPSPPLQSQRKKQNSGRPRQVVRTRAGG
jgi:hypothetical protein